MGAGSPAIVSATAAPAAQSEELKSRPRAASEPVVGPEARIATLLHLHYARVWRALRRFGVDASSADDAAQEAFIVLSRRLEDVRVGSEQTFLLGCAVRIAANYRRSAHAKREVDQALTLDDEPDPRPSAEQLLDHKRLRQALDELLESWPDDIRVAFVLFELEGLSVSEIAQVTDTKLGTVASRLRRARELFEAGAKRLRARADGGGR